MNEQIQSEDIVKTVSESIKLIKNTKGYNWEVRIMPSDKLTNMLSELDIDRLAKLNIELEKTYGNEQI